MPNRLLAIRDAVRFFADHAGYATPPGRMACAASLAEAECRAERVGLVYRWEEDQDPDWSWREEGVPDYPMLCCLVFDPRDLKHPLASLGGIDLGAEGTFNSHDPYRRVIEAELASEAFATHYSASWEAV
jgi:hypothetical protein